MSRRLFAKGRKKKETIFPDLASDIEDIISEYTQIDPELKTQRCYVKVTAGYIRKELILKKAYALEAFCERSVNNILNRLGYSLKKVLKTKPLKKTPYTDAIFENVARRHEEAKNNPRILRISVDVKASVKIGNLSRGGYSRLIHAPIADDHDQKWDAVLLPVGIYELNTDNVFIVFGHSKQTSDFIVDALELWWNERQFIEDQYDMIMIDLDNGKPVAGNTKRFLQRIVDFSKKINMPLQLVYYPPYHSKYNAVERVWAALEQYWKPLILDTVANTLKIAGQMLWKGMNPIVRFIDKIYKKARTVTSYELKELDNFIVRNAQLKNWDIRINPYKTG